MIGETELIFTKVNSTAFRVWWNRDRNFTGYYNITAPPSDQQMLVSHDSIPFADFEGVLSSTVYNVLVETGPSGPVAAGSVRTGKFIHLQLMVIPHSLRQQLFQGIFCQKYRVRVRLQLAFRLGLGFRLPINSLDPGN